MAMSVIGALRVVLGADTATLESDLNRANKTLARFAKQVVSALAIGAAVRGFTQAIGRVIGEADKLGDMAEQFGVPVEQLSRLSHAAQLNDVSLEALGKSLSRLSRGMADAAKGTGPAADAFASLGISVKGADGSLKSASEILPEVADRFSKMEDGTTKAALAQMLFGRTGVEMIEMLNQGADAMRRQMGEADKLGIVVSTKTANAADQFSKSLITLGKVFDGIFMKIAEAMLPSLNALTQQILSVAKNSNIAEQAGQMFATWLEEGSVLVIKARVELEKFNLQLANMKALWDAATGLDPRAFWNAFIEGLFGAKGAITDVNKEIQGFRDRLNLEHAFSSFIDGTNKAKDSTDKWKGEIRDLNAEKKIATEADRAWQATLREANKVIEETRTPLEEYKHRLMEISVLLQQGLITSDQWAAAQEKAAERAGISFNAMATTTAGAFGDIGKAFETFGKQNEELFRVGQAFGIAEAIVSSYVAFTKALASGVPPLNYIVAAAVLAKGLAAVATIAATKPTGFAMGGSFKVPGGESFTDNVMMPLKLASGEQVDITRDNGPRGRLQEVVLTGIRPRDFFTGDMLRDLFDSLNTGMSNGYKLKVA